MRGGDRVGVIHIDQDAPDPFQVGLAGLGERQLAGRAVHQPGAQMGFQVGDVAGNDGVGQFQRLGGAGKAALLDHLGKYAH